MKNCKAKGRGEREKRPMDKERGKEKREKWGERGGDRERESELEREMGESERKDFKMKRGREVQRAVLAKP